MWKCCVHTRLWEISSPVDALWLAPSLYWSVKLKVFFVFAFISVVQPLGDIYVLLILYPTMVLIGQKKLIVSLCFAHKCKKKKKMYIDHRSTVEPWLTQVALWVISFCPVLQRNTSKTIINIKHELNMNYWKHLPNSLQAGVFFKAATRLFDVDGQHFGHSLLTRHGGGVSPLRSTDQISRKGRELGEWHPS